MLPVSAQIKILASDPALLRALEDRYYAQGDPELDPPKAVHGGIIVPLSLQPVDGGYVGRISDLVPEPPAIRPQLHFAEWGGATENYGDACVWAGPHGEKMYAYYQPMGKRRVCGEHAYFAVSFPVIGIENRRDPGGRMLDIVRYTISANWRERTANVYVEELFWGTPSSLPATLAYLREAVMACEGKAQCMGCSESHYAKVPEPKKEVA